MKKQLLIAGGSGLIGTALSKEALQQGWDITILSRFPHAKGIAWDPSKRTIEIPGKQYFDAIINLAGTSILEGRWTEKKKKEIYLSRVNACLTLEKYLEDGRLSTSVYIGISGVGIYGDAGVEVVNEETRINHHDDWFVKTTIDWEAAHQQIASLGIRTMILRTGIALSALGGALKEIIASPGFGVLVYFGKGNQIVPWIHIGDLARLIMFGIVQPHISGTFLASAPYPVSNKVLTQSINHHLRHKRMVMGVPKFVMSIVLGEMHRVLFESCNATSEKIQKEGFEFDFPSIDAAIRNLLKK